MKALEESMRCEPEWPAHAVNWLALSMAHHRLGRADEARRWLGKAVDFIEKARRKRPLTLVRGGMNVHDWTACTLLRREAEREVLEETASTPRATMPTEPAAK